MVGKRTTTRSVQTRASAAKANAPLPEEDAIDFNQIDASKTKSKSAMQKTAAPAQSNKRPLKMDVEPAVQSPAQITPSSNATPKPGQRVAAGTPQKYVAQPKTPTKPINELLRQPTSRISPAPKAGATPIKAGGIQKKFTPKTLEFESSSEPDVDAASDKDDSDAEMIDLTTGSDASDQEDDKFEKDSFLVSDAESGAPESDDSDHSDAFDEDLFRQRKQQKSKPVRKRTKSRGSVLASKSTKPLPMPTIIRRATSKSSPTKRAKTSDGNGEASKETSKAKANIMKAKATMSKTMAMTTKVKAKPKTKKPKTLKHQDDASDDVDANPDSADAEDAYFPETKTGARKAPETLSAETTMAGLDFSAKGLLAAFLSMTPLGVTFYAWKDIMDYDVGMPMYGELKNFTNGLGLTFEKGARYWITVKGQTLINAVRLLEYPSYLEVPPTPSSIFQTSSSSAAEDTVTIVGLVTAAEGVRNVHTKMNRDTQMREVIIQTMTENDDLCTIPITLWGGCAQITPRIGSGLLLVNAKPSVFLNYPRLSVGDYGTIVVLRGNGDGPDELAQVAQIRCKSIQMEESDDTQGLPVPSGAVPWSPSDEEVHK